MFLLFELPIEQHFIHIKNILWDAFGKSSQKSQNQCKLIFYGLQNVIQTHPNDPVSPKANWICYVLFYRVWLSSVTITLDDIYKKIKWSP